MAEDAAKEVIRESAEAIQNELADLAIKFKASLPAPGVPRCADLSDLAWLYDIGYRSFLLCDELCLEEQLLRNAVNVFAAFREDYSK